MGVLYNVTKLQNNKREFMIDRLQELGIVKTKDGKPVHELSYQELKMELAMAEICNVDVENPENKWF